MKNFQFSKYCSPAQLYLVLGAIGIISAAFNKFSIETLLTHALFLVIWAWVLNWLCSKGFKAISWILVLLPFIMALFTYFLAKDVVREGYDYDGDLENELDAQQNEPDDTRTREQKKQALIPAQDAKNEQKQKDNVAALKAAEIEKQKKEDAADAAAVEAARAKAGSSKDPRYNKAGQAAKDYGIGVGSAVAGGIHPVAGATYDYFSEGW